MKPDVVAFLDELTKLSGIPRNMPEVRGTSLSKEQRTYLFNRINAHAFGKRAKESNLPHLSQRLEVRSWGKHNRQTAREALEKLSLDMNYFASIPQRAGYGAKKGAIHAMTQAGKGIGALTTPKQSWKQGLDLAWNPESIAGGKAHPAETMLWRGLMASQLGGGVLGLMSKEDPTGRGHSRLRRGLRMVGEQAGGIMGSPHGFWGGLAASMVAGKAGDSVGAALDRLRGYRRHQPHLPPRPQGLEM